MLLCLCQAWPTWSATGPAQPSDLDRIRFLVPATPFAGLVPDRAASRLARVSHGLDPPSGPLPPRSVKRRATNAGAIRHPACDDVPLSIGN